MSKSLVIQVTVYDDETGSVEQTIVRHSGSQYHWEVTSAFGQLGEKVADVIDPDYEK